AASRRPRPPSTGAATRAEARPIGLETTTPAPGRDRRGAGERGCGFSASRASGWTSVWWTRGAPCERATTPRLLLEAASAARVGAHAELGGLQRNRLGRKCVDAALLLTRGDLVRAHRGDAGQERRAVGIAVAGRELVAAVRLDAHRALVVVLLRI